MRVTVTGAAGFLGSSVCRAAASSGHDVLGLVRPGELHVPVPGVAYRELEWSNGTGLLRHVLDEHRTEAIVHAAGMTPRVTEDTAALYEANVRLVWTLLTAVAEAEVDPAVVVVSTGGVYGLDPPVPTTEDAPLDAASHYAWTKVLTEDVARAFARSGRLRVCIARPFNLIGTGEPLGSVVSDVAAQLDARPAVAEVRLRETASVRDYVDVDDAARALLLLAERGVPGEAYNIASGRGVSVVELTQAMLDVWGSDARIIAEDPTARGTISIGEPAKLRALGWDAETTLAESVEHVRQGMRDRRRPGESDVPAAGDQRRAIPLSVPVVGQKESAYIDECLASGWLSGGGAFVQRLEDAIRDVTGARFAVACQSGTAAIHVGLRLAGVGLDDEVIVPTLTFIATVNPIAYLGAHPVFVDCDEYMNMDPHTVAAFLETECARTADGTVNNTTGRRVAAILPVHVFGNPCDIEALDSIARQWGIPLIEDAAESLGASWTAGAFAGRHTGTVGLAGCLSFNSNKIITTGGGGMILTDDEAFAERARHLTTQAKADPVRFVHDEVGYNYRLTNVQAAIGVAQLETLAERIDRKCRNRAHYEALLAGVTGIQLLGSPPGTAPNHWFYSALVDSEQFGMDREELMSGLAERGIQTRPVWFPNHLQEPYKGEHACETPRAQWFWERVLNLPCTHTLDVGDIEFVCDAIRELGGR